jgi:hypothetical protein
MSMELLRTIALGAGRDREAGRYQIRHASAGR